MSGLNHEAVDLLRRRARRRLIGAVVLVLVTLGLLWKSTHQTPRVFKPAFIQVTASGTVDATSNTTDLSDSSLPTVDSPIVEQADNAKKTEDLSNSSKALRRTLGEPKKTDVAKQNVAKDQATNSLRKSPPPILTKANYQVTKQITNPLKTSKTTSQKINKQPSQHIMVQLAALSDPKRVEALKQKLANIGIYATFTPVKTSNGEVVRVRIGPFLGQAEAEQMLRKLTQHGFFGTILYK